MTQVYILVIAYMIQSYDGQLPTYVCPLVATLVEWCRALQETSRMFQVSRGSRLH